MTFNLGIDIGEDRVTAAYERSGTMRLVTFGRVRSTPLRVHIGTNGEVSTGDAAEHAAAVDPGGDVSNVGERFAESKSVVVNGYAVTGETLLAHVITGVIDHAEDQAESGPVGRVAVAHAATWTAPTRAALSGALAQIGLADAEVILASQAATQAPESARNLPEQAPALGAAVLAARRARSSGGGIRAGRPPSTRPTPPVPTDAPTSVFDPTNPEASNPPVSNRPVSHGSGNPGSPVGAGALAGAAAAGGATFGGGPGDGGSGGSPPSSVAPLGDESDDDGSLPRIYLVAGAALLVLVVVLGILVLGRGDGETTVQATGPTGPDTSTTSSTTSTVASTTTSTSTTSTSTTTTSTTTTSTTTTTIPSTTTTPRAIGKIALSEVGLILDFGTDDSTTVVFGDSAAGALSAIRARAGSITDDSGWTQNTFCTGVMTRRVHFGDLEVVFSADEEENQTFEQWFVDSPGTRPVGLVSLDRLGIGSTLADLRKVYGNLLRVSQPSDDADEGLFTTGQSERYLDGVLSGVEDTSTVQQIWAGSACQRVPD